MISDTHFGHSNIVEYCNRPKNHDALMIKNWFNIVGVNDPLLHLGDIAVWYGADQKQWEQKVRKLPGKKKMIIGNHDERSSSFYRGLGFGILKPFKAILDDVVFLFSHYPEFYFQGCGWDTNIHGHSHTHKKKHWSNHHINISIEHMNYKPVRLKDIIDV